MTFIVGHVAYIALPRLQNCTQSSDEGQSARENDLGPKRAKRSAAADRRSAERSADGFFASIFHPQAAAAQRGARKSAAKKRAAGTEATVSEIIFKRVQMIINCFRPKSMSRRERRHNQREERRSTSINPVHRVRSGLSNCAAPARRSRSAPHRWRNRLKSRHRSQIPMWLLLRKQQTDSVDHQFRQRVSWISQPLSKFFRSWCARWKLSHFRSFLAGCYRGFVTVARTYSSMVRMARRFCQSISDAVSRTCCSVVRMPRRWCQSISGAVSSTAFIFPVVTCLCFLSEAFFGWDFFKILDWLPLFGYHHTPRSAFGPSHERHADVLRRRVQVLHQRAHLDLLAAWVDGDSRRSLRVRRATLRLDFVATLADALRIYDAQRAPPPPPPWYRRCPSIVVRVGFFLFLIRVVLWAVRMSLLLLCGDVETNPGPKGGSKKGEARGGRKRVGGEVPGPPNRRRKKQAAAEDQPEDPKAIRLEYMPEGCPFCHRKPFFRGFSSEHCCESGDTASQKLLDPLPEDIAAEMRRPGFSAHSIQVNDALAVSSLSYSGGRVYVGGGKQTNKAPPSGKRKGAPQSLKIKGTTSTRLLPTNAGGGDGNSHNPLGWFLCPGKYPAREARADELRHYADLRKIEGCLVAENKLYSSLVRERDAFNAHDDGELQFQEDSEGSIEVKFFADGEKPPEEVAAYIDEPGKSTTPRVLRIRKREDIDPETDQPREQFIHALDPKWEPLRYPLLYPTGKGGWGPDHEVSLLKHFRRLVLREPRFRDNKALGQAWMVDTYSRVEDERLGFHLGQQKESMKAAGKEVDETEKMDGIDLPASFVKSDSWFRERLSSSMTLLARYGKPDFFVT